MLAVNRGLKRSIYHVLMLLAASALVASPAMAQINTVDPNDVIDSDLGTPPPAPATAPAADVAPTVQDGVPTDAPAKLPETSSSSSTSPAIPTENTYQQDDLIGVAEGVFGKSAQGIAKFIEDILKKEGRPNAYIVGREGGGAFVVGLRYGSGTLNHKVEGKMPIYWTGPSIGPDVGANTGSTFVLVYNLYDTEDIFRRYPSGEGVAYVGGGFNASYLARGDVVLITIRVGAGIRLGTNIGYMHFSKKQRWLPF